MVLVKHVAVRSRSVESGSGRESGATGRSRSRSECGIRRSAVLVLLLAVVWGGVAAGGAALTPDAGAAASGALPGSDGTPLCC